MTTSNESMLETGASSPAREPLRLRMVARPAGTPPNPVAPSSQTGVPGRVA